jgi:hypothetical protein
MFAAARISDASDRVIQSAAATRYSEAAVGLGLSPSPEGWVEGPSVTAALSEASFELVRLGPDRLERSFFAQPEPLKTIAEGTIAFRIVPSAPHAEQYRGPSSWTPWITSSRWSQALQM